MAKYWTAGSYSNLRNRVAVTETKANTSEMLSPTHYE